MIAEMIDLLLGWDVAVVVGEHYEMNSYRLTIETHSSVATAMSCARGRTIPDVAG